MNRRRHEVAPRAPRPVLAHGVAGVALPPDRNDRCFGMGTTVHIVALVALCATTGCGASAMERATMVAGAFHMASQGSAELLDDEADRAVDRETTEQGVRDAIEARRPMEAAQHTFAASIDGYVTALRMRAREESPDMSDVMAAGLRVLDVYEQVRALAHELGVDLPSITGAVLPLLQGVE